MILAFRLPVRAVLSGRHLELRVSGFLKMFSIYADFGLLANYPFVDGVTFLPHRFEDPVMTRFLWTPHLHSAMVSNNYGAEMSLYCYSCSRQPCQPCVLCLFEMACFRSVLNPGATCLFFLTVHTSWRDIAVRSISPYYRVSVPRPFQLPAIVRRASLPSSCTQELRSSARPVATVNLCGVEKLFE